MRARSGLPFVWPSWIAPLIAGDKHCTYAAWFKAHFQDYDKIEDPDFNFADWTADHTALVLARKQEFITAGLVTMIEDQNTFRLKGEGAVLSGKPDLIGRTIGQAVISDAKTGKPKHGDWWQVAIYIAALRRLPHSRQWGTIEGELVYKDGTHRRIQSHEVTGEHERKIFQMIRLVSAPEEPAPVPSGLECSRCDIGECQSRFKSTAAAGETKEF
jgi:CRISPR/Cas system-associated exonuclease Cas4 (RecB family)